MKLRTESSGNLEVLRLPEELLGRLNLKQGERVELSDLSGGGFRLALCNADFQKAMAILDDVMVQYHDTLKKLADS